jgi:stearoyl-CoA desaturase (delta-9 desaturase)
MPTSRPAGRGRRRCGCSIIVLGSTNLERVMKFKTDALIGFILCHSLAALALIAWFFSWTGVALCAAGMFAFGILGINVGFHRLIAHRGFSCPLWLEHTFAILGTLSLQFSPALWVAVHRRHHHHADDEQDPHSPLRGFFWAHFGWLLMRSGDMRSRPLIERYAKDVMRDPLYAMLERKKTGSSSPFCRGWRCSSLAIVPS